MKKYRVIACCFLTVYFQVELQAQVLPSLVAITNNDGNVSQSNTTQRFEIESSILKVKRRIIIHVPPSYFQSASTRRYPVTVITDGEYLLASVTSVTDELSSHGQIPEMVLVGIENVGGSDALAANTKRVFDLTPPGLSVSGSGLKQGGDLFLDFIEKELLPAVDRQFKTEAPRFFIGLSSGGVLATYAAATRTSYSAVVSLDAPVHLDDGWLGNKLISRASRSDEFLVRYASLEATFGWPEDLWKTLRDKAPSGWTLYREKFKLEGHETMQMIGSYIGLKQVFHEYSRFSIPENSTSVLPYYNTLSKNMRGNLIPPKVVLQQTIQNLISEARGAMAKEVYTLLVFGYGAQPDSAKTIAQLLDTEKNPQTETVESLLSTPFPTPAEAKPFLGEWIGDIWMGPDQPRSGNTMLRIRVVNGKVVGETIRKDPSGTEHIQLMGYMKITPSGLSWGRLNDKQPKGVMLFEGTLHGDVLDGQAQFAGIKLDDPPPPLLFSFKRKLK